MKTIHLIPYMHPSAGGPPVVADRFCRHLVALGWEAEIITSNSYARNEDLSWVDDYEAPYQMTVLPSVGPQGFGYSSSLGKTLEDKIASADVVHIHNLWSYFNFTGSRICQRNKVPYVVSTHGMLDPNSLSRKSWKKTVYGNLIEWPRLRNASGMIYTHPEEQRLAETQCDGLPSGFVVPLASDPPPNIEREVLKGEFLKSFPELENSKRIVFLGRLHSKKGLDLLIPAMAKIREEVDNVVLVLVGPCEENYLAELKHLAKSSGVEDVCKFVGPRSGKDKWAALAAADLFALPSYQENFAIALVEALSVGTPAVISKRINIWEEIEDAKAGVLTELSQNGVADACLSLLRDEDLVTRTGQAAKRFAENQYSWSRSALELDSIYRSLAARGATS